MTIEVETRAFAKRLLAAQRSGRKSTYGTVPSFASRSIVRASSVGS